MHPQIADNEGIDYRAWLCGIPSFADDWPRGVLSANLEAPCFDAKPAPARPVSQAGFGFIAEADRIRGVRAA